MTYCIKTTQTCTLTHTHTLDNSFPGAHMPPPLARAPVPQGNLIQQLDGTFRRSSTGPRGPCPPLSGVAVLGLSPRPQKLGFWASGSFFYSGEDSEHPSWVFPAPGCRPSHLWHFSQMGRKGQSTPLQPL